jgi:hypothetical protein
VQCFSRDGLATLIMISTILIASGIVSKHASAIQNVFNMKE